MAGILAAGLVTVPPDSNGSEPTDARAVRITSFAVPSAARLGARHGDVIVLGQAGRHTPVTVVAVSGTRQANAGQGAEPAAGATVITTASATAVAAGSAVFDPRPVLAPLLNNSVVGPIVLFGAIAFVLFVYAPVAWLVQTVYGLFAGVLGLPPTLPLPGTVVPLTEATARVASGSVVDPSPRDPSPVAATLAESTDAAPANEAESRSRSQRTRTTPSAEADETSTDTAGSTNDSPETATAAGQASTGLAPAGVAEPSTKDSTPKSQRQMAPRHQVRVSPRSDEQSREPSHSGNGRNRLAANDGASPRKSPSTDSSPSSQSSPGGDSAGESSDGS